MLICRNFIFDDIFAQILTIQLIFWTLKMSSVFLTLYYFLPLIWCFGHFCSFILFFQKNSIGSLSCILECAAATTNSFSNWNFEIGWEGADSCSNLLISRNFDSAESNSFSVLILLDFPLHFLNYDFWRSGFDFYSIGCWNSWWCASISTILTIISYLQKLGSWHFSEYMAASAPPAHLGVLVNLKMSSLVLSIWLYRSSAACSSFSIPVSAHLVSKSTSRPILPAIQRHGPIDLFSWFGAPAPATFPILWPIKSIWSTIPNYPLPWKI